jgi:hypothetical protein
LTSCRQKSEMILEENPPATTPTSIHIAGNEK